MTSNYTRRTPIDSTPAPCYPERRKAICLTCTRWRSAAPIPPERRKFVIIDASLFFEGEECGMHEARPAVRAFAEV